MDRIRETGWCNPFWRHFEKLDGNDNVIGEVTASIHSGEMIIKKRGWLGMWSEKRIQVDVAKIETAAYQALL